MKDLSFSIMPEISRSYSVCPIVTLWGTDCSDLSTSLGLLYEAFFSSLDFFLGVDCFLSFSGVTTSLDFFLDLDFLDFSLDLEDLFWSLEDFDFAFSWTGGFIGKSKPISSCSSKGLSSSSFLSVGRSSNAGKSLENLDFLLTRDFYISSNDDYCFDFNEGAF